MANPQKPPHGPVPPGLGKKDRVKMRADRVMDQAKDQTFPLAVSSRHGHVQFSSLVQKVDQNGFSYVEIYLRGQTESGDPHFRIWNPPLLVEDPQGPIEVGGKHYREDPLQALAEVIARNGGRRKDRR